MKSGSAGKVDYYEVLEVAQDAPQHEIHKAYRRAKATYSQDNPALYSMFTREEARDLLRLIEEAYAVLGNHGLRRNYDDELRKNPRPAPGLGIASNMASNASKLPDSLAHDSLPDFVVPDPSIPGSENIAHAKPTPVQTTPPPAAASANPVSAPIPMDPIHTATTGVKESILITNAEFTVRKRDTLPLMPPDTGRCPLGTYKIDPAIEKEIEDATEFDGPFLQRIRTYKQVSLEKLSVASRIGKTYLIALESNDFKNLPATVFLRGFLVQVAKQLGIDESKVVTSYMNLAKAAKPDKYGP
ncbi:MAG: helix-turn-helix domain-containing protein [Bdellovibrionales bacterium]|nr:helix-turn-helix domain-containing protein [Bdellovibrionales bacterium]